MQLLKFISTETLCPEFRKLAPEIIGEKTHLYTVIGTVTSYYPSRFNKIIGGTLFGGNIKATGVSFLGEYTSLKVFFPEKIADLFMVVFNDPDKEGEIDFGFDVFIEKESSETGYKIIYSPLIPIKGE